MALITSNASESTDCNLDQVETCIIRIVTYDFIDGLYRTRLEE
jgi:hypothetical protein